MYKKVNIDALCEAVALQNPLNYCDAKAEQYKSIVYVTPGSFQFSVENLVGISLRLTGRWNEVSATSPDSVDTIYMTPRLVLSVVDLLPEFILEGEEWSDEAAEDDDDEA